MAVNLKATATLNGKPFLKTLSALEAATRKLSTADAKTGKKAQSGIDARIRSYEKEADAALKANKAVEQGVRSNTRATQVLDRSTAEYGRTLARINAESDAAINRMARMTNAQLGLASASERLRIARRNLADVMSVDREAGDPQLLRAEEALGRAEIAHRRALNARREEVYANQKAAETERERNQAVRDGNALASEQAARYRNMTAEALQLDNAKRRLATAEANLAKAYAMTAGAARDTAIRKASTELANATIAVNGLTQAQSELGKSGPDVARGLAAQRHLYRDLSRQAAMTSLTLAALPAIGITTAVVWEKAYSNVVRTADVAFSEAPERVEALRKSLVSMVQTMPVSFGAVTEIATLANQMGIATSQVDSFTRAVAMFSATSGVSVDMTATAFGRLTSILGNASIPFMEMSDAILKVGVNSVATEDEIINVNTQISSIAGQAGFSAREMIALSGALASVRVPPELSRGLITRVFGQIDKAVAAGGTGLDTLARISGRTSEQFRKQWGKEGSADLFNDFLRGLRDAGANARSELESIGITSVRDVPVTLRLANAADSDGNVGELFTQTLRDANESAGETQRQYSIMAETVASKLKMLGGNLLAFFDAAGRSSLGSFGGLIDGLTKGVRNMTRDLDKPLALIGDVFGVTNADAIGLIASIALIGSGLSLVAASALKFMQIMRASGHAIALFGGKTGITAGLTSLVNTMSRGLLAANSFFGATKVGSAAMAKGAGTATTLTGAIKGLGAAFGPVGLAITAAAAALFVWHDAAKQNATTSEALAESLAMVDARNITEVSEALKSITVVGPKDFLGWEMNSNPFEGGVTGYRAALDEMDRLRNANKYHWFDGEKTFEIGHWLSRTLQGAWDSFDGLKKVDEGIQGLVDSGNSAQAAKLLQQLARDGSDLQKLFDSGAGANIESFLKQAFALADVEWNSENIDKFAKGTLPAVTDALYGVAGATKTVTELFDDDVEQMGKFANTLDEAAAAFINYSSAVAAGTKTNANGEFESFSLPDFSAALRTQVAEQQQWVDDITVISRHGSAAVVEALASMGPEGRHAAQALAQGLKEGTPEATEALAALEAAVVAEAAGLGNAIAETMANQAWAARILGSDVLAKNLVASLGDDKMSQLYDAAQGVGEETVERILQGLARDGDFDAALNKLLAAQPVDVDVNLSTKDLNKSLNVMRGKLQQEGKLPISAEVINAETTISQFKGMLNDPALTEIVMNGNLTLTEAYAESAEFRAWAAANGVDMYLGANDLPARTTLAALVAAGNDAQIRAELQALPAPAEGTLWDFIQLADGSRAYVQVDGDGKPAEGTLSYVVNKAGKTTAQIKVTAADHASGTIDYIARSRTSYVNVVTTHSSTGLYTGGGRMFADGGVVEYYAKGGLRENHTAQIAPAGAMRVWAEPETGGEAYIPLAKSKRARSLSILDEVAERFGYQLAARHDNVIQYNDGGAYNASRMFRATAAAAHRSSRNSSKGSWEFHVHNPQHKDPLQDMWDKVQSYNPGFGFDDD